MNLILIIAAGIVAILITLLLLPGRTPAIAGSEPGRSVARLEQVVVGGARQWILIRGEDAGNPILLLLHGGPGTSQLTLMRKHTRELERHYTVVNWDQRGAGKSYAAIRDRERMTLEQCVRDTIELSELLAARFGKRKITLVGHSWGSALGVLASARRPDLYAAYIGIGQVSDAPEGERISYDWTLEQARAAGDASVVRTLAAIGPPPYTGAWQKKFITERRLLGKYGGELWGSSIGAFGLVIRHLLLSTEYTLVDRVNFFRGIMASVALMFPDLLRVNLFAQVPELQVPVWFMLGRHDYEVPSVLSARYFEALRAPRKTLYWFEHAAHFPNTEEWERYTKILIEEVLPVSRGDA
jgi:pimeloyl-ACP methyl ester carboxylesterase